MPALEAAAAKLAFPPPQDGAGGAPPHRRGLIRTCLDSLVIGWTLDEDIARRFRGQAAWGDIDPTTAQEKLGRILERHRERFAWRPVVATP